MGIEFLLLSLFLGLIGTGAGLFSNLSTNEENSKSVDKTNEANLQAVRETNASNVEQAELAYQRSLPVNQIADMRAAGVSLPAAINKLTGGGSYQLPAMQAGSSMAKQFDFSGIGEAVSRLSNIPSNVQNMRMQQLQMDSLKQKIEFERTEQIRLQEQHDFDMWQKLYGKNATMQIDSLSSQIVSMAADRGVSLDDIDSTDKLVSAFDLGSNETWRNMPNMARSQVLEAVRLQAAENRANQHQQNENRASLDAHNMSLIAQDLQKVELKYADKKAKADLLALLRSSENLLQDGKIKYQDAKSKEFENVVREAGIDSEAKAREVAMLAQKMAADDELDIQHRRSLANKGTGHVWNQFRVALRDLGELLLHVKL